MPRARLVLGINAGTSGCLYRFTRGNLGRADQESGFIAGMLENLGEHVRECLRRAEESAERAKREPNLDIQRDFLEMEGRWLKLALSFQFLERLGSFTRNNNQKRTELSRRLEQLNHAIKGENKP